MIFGIGELARDRDFRVSFVIKRPAPTSLAHEGEAQLSYYEMRATGASQPTRPDEVQMLPQGSQLDNLRSFWCNQELRAADGDTTEADVILYRGKSYRVLKVDQRDERGFFKAIAQGYVT